jgi:hypothetical protein
MITKKKCTKCGEIKPLESFSKQKNGKYGKKSNCRECVAAINRDYHQRNKNRIAEQQRDYRQRNSNHIAVRMRNNYQKNKSRHAEYGRNYRKEKPEVHRSTMRKRRALKRNLPHAPLTPAQYERLYEFRDQVFGEVTP